MERQPISWVPLVDWVIKQLVAKLGEGKYGEKREYYPNGTLKSVTVGCFGAGICGMNATTQSGEPISTTNDNSFQGNYEVNFDIIKTNDKKILLGMLGDKVNSEAFDRFFYSDTISFLNTEDKYIIDNLDFLNSIGESEPIIILGGEYAVKQTPDGGKYIVIKDI